MRTETVSANRVQGHIAHADSPRGGVFMLPTITGVDAPSQALAQQLAQAGMTTLIWNPFPGEPALSDHNALMARAGKLSDDVVEDLRDCVGYMLDKLHVKAVAVLGFCLGGRYSLLHAAVDRRLVACVAFYPSVRVPLMANQSRDAVALAPQIACPVHLVQAGNDQVILHPTFLKLRDALHEREAATVVQFHPGAVHSFMRPDLQADPANARATRLSWPQAMAFMQAGLG